MWDWNTFSRKAEHEKKELEDYIQVHVTVLKYMSLAGKAKNETMRGLVIESVEYIYIYIVSMSYD